MKTSSLVLRHATMATVAALALSRSLAAQGYPAEEIPAQSMVPALNEMLPADIREAGTISLVTDANYPPCQWFVEDGSMVGFEVDIWDALAGVLGVDLDIESIDFAGLIPGVQGGRYDIAMECISDRVEREEVVTFVNHTLSYGNAFYYLEANENITAGDPTSLCGLASAGQSGTDFLVHLAAFSDWCEAQDLEPLTIGEFPQQSAVLLALFSGRIDFALSESSAVEEVRANNPVDVATISNPLEKNFYLGIVTRKEDTELQQALLAALREIKSSGVYGDIMSKWSLQHAALDDFGINMTTTNPLD